MGEGLYYHLSLVCSQNFERLGLRIGNVFINTRLFKHSKESSFFHILATVYRYNNRFIGNWVVIQLMRAFGTFINKPCCSRILIRCLGFKFIRFPSLKSIPKYCCHRGWLRLFLATLQYTIQ